MGRPALGVTGDALRVCMLLHKSVVHDSRVRREAAALVAAGHEVTVVELAAVDSPCLDGFHRVSVLPRPWVKRLLPFQLYRLVFAWRFVGAARRVHPQVVHAHDVAMLLPGLLTACTTGARLVYDSHELATSVPYRDRRWAWFVAMIERLAVPRAAAVLTVSDGIAARLQQRYSLVRWPTVVRNVCGLPAADGTARSLRDELGIGSEPLVLHLGSAASGRGGDVLIAALASLERAHLVFVGPDRGEAAGLRAEAAARGVARRVHVLDAVALEQLLEVARQADVGVSLLQDTCENHRLALPNKVFEYLAAGLPMVVSDLPELRQLIDRFGVGWTARPDEPAEVAEALRRALAEAGDPALEARLRRAAGELTWPRESERLLALYRDVGRSAVIPK